MWVPVVFLCYLFIEVDFRLVGEAEANLLAIPINLCSPRNIHHRFYQHLFEDAFLHYCGLMMNKQAPHQVEVIGYFYLKFGQESIQTSEGVGNIYFNCSQMMLWQNLLSQKSYGCLFLSWVYSLNYRRLIDNYSIMDFELSCSSNLWS